MFLFFKILIFKIKFFIRWRGEQMNHYIPAFNLFLKQVNNILRLTGNIN